MSEQADDLDSGFKSKSRRKLLALIGSVLIFILAVGGYGTYAYLYNKWPFSSFTGSDAAVVAGEKSMSDQDAAALMADQYIRFDSAFTFNLPGENRRGHMVQVDVALVVHGVQNATVAQKHLPLISATISEICAQQDYESLASPSGRERFKRLLLDGIRTKLTGVINDPVVEQVLFTNFVMQ